jgi:peptide chain release factor 2
MSFYKEGELTAEELDEQYSGIANHIEAIEFKNMLSDEGDSYCSTDYCSAGGTESALGRNAYACMYDVGGKIWHKIKELNFKRRSSR